MSMYKVPYQPHQISPQMCESSKDLCAVAFSALEAYFFKTQMSPQLAAKIPDVRCPLFVTYMTLEDDLRGCIGNLGPL